MIYPFSQTNSRKIMRIVSATAAAFLCATMFTGCFKKSNTPTTEPASGPNLVDTPTTETTEAATTEPTTVATTEAPKVNVAIVKEQVGVRAAPTTDSNVLLTLNAGDEVTVNRVETIGATQWAYIPVKGWVQTDSLDMSNVTISGATSTPASGSEDGAPTTTTAPSSTTGSTTGSGQTGTITASELNIRQSPSTAAASVGKYTKGTQVTILETSNGWGRTDKGWVSMDYVYVDGTTGKNTAKGLVTGNGLNVRSGPGTNYNSVASYAAMTRVNILEQVKVGGTTWGCTKDGWISLSYVYIDGTTAEGSTTGTISGSNVNIRSGPGTNYDRVGSYNSGDTVQVYAQFTVGNMKWGCTSKGWVSMDYVEVG